MTNEDIVQRLREDYCQCVNEPEYKPIRCYTCEAADTIERLLKERDEARAEQTGLEATFDLMWKADMRAITLWQTATGKTAATSPAADLCEDCPRIGHSTDRTRCLSCPRRAADQRVCVWTHLIEMRTWTYETGCGNHHQYRVGSVISAACKYCGLPIQFQEQQP